MPTVSLNAKKKQEKNAIVVERKEILHIPHGMLRCDKNVINLLNLIDYRSKKETFTRKRDCYAQRLRMHFVIIIVTACHG